LLVVLTYLFCRSRPPQTPEPAPPAAVPVVLRSPAAVPVASPTTPATARPAGPEAEAGEAVFKGKPTSYWINQPNDRDPVRCKAAAVALGGSGPAAVAVREIGPAAHASVPALVTLLRTRQGDAGVCRAAVEALGKIGPGSKSAVPALVEKLGDGDRDVRMVATWALGKIGPEAR